MDPLDDLLSENPTIWVFGYGSLLWKTDFSYKSKAIGFIEGYERKFNQGNETFRGEPGKPGRVANLEQKIGSKTWGVAYEISGRQEVSKALKKLYLRESQCGGYISIISTFFPREYAALDERLIDSDSGSESPPDSFRSSDEEIEFKGIGVSTMRRTISEKLPISNSCPPVTKVDEKNRNILIESSPDFPPAVRDGSNASAASSGTIWKGNMTSVQVLLYTATPDNTLYLGNDTLSDMAHQIVDSKGTAGTNVEYVMKIADYVRKHIPEDDDEYLFALEEKIREEQFRRIHKRMRGSNNVEKLRLDPDLEHNEALLKSITATAS